MLTEFVSPHPPRWTHQIWDVHDAFVTNAALRNLVIDNQIDTYVALQLLST